MIRNLAEDHVLASYEALRAHFPDFCGCEVCRDDTLVYALNRVPARFSPSRLHRRPFYKRLVHGASVLESGLLLPKKQALSAIGSNMALGELALGHKPKRLVSELVPSWVARQARA